MTTSNPSEPEKEKTLGTQIELWLHELLNLIFKFPYTFFVLIFQPKKVVETFNDPVHVVQRFIRPYSFLTINMIFVVLVIMRLMDIGWSVDPDSVFHIMRHGVFTKGQFNVLITAVIIFPTMLLYAGFSLFLERISERLGISMPYQYTLYYLTLIPYLIGFLFWFLVATLELFLELSLISSIIIILLLQVVWIRPFILLNANKSVLGKLLGVIYVGTIFLVISLVNMSVLVSWHDKWRQTVILSDPKLNLNSDGTLEMELKLESKLHLKDDVKAGDVFLYVHSDRYSNYQSGVFGYFEPKMHWNGKVVEALELYPGANGKAKLSVKYDCHSLSSLLTLSSNGNLLHADLTVELTNGQASSISASSDWSSNLLKKYVEEKCSAKH